MAIERLSQIMVAVMVALGTLLVWSGQATSPLWPLTILATGVSLYVTDFKGWLKLHRILGNLIALAAGIYFLPGILRTEDANQLLVAAKLLCVVQILLLFQVKNSARYWQLVLLSVAQVVVAGSINVGVLYGVGVAAFMACSVMTLCVLSLRREMRRFSPAPEIAQAASSSGGEAASAVERSVASDGSTPARRWPMAAGEAVFFSTAVDLPARGLFRRLARPTCVIGASTVIFAALVFALFPRTSGFEWEIAGPARRHMVGFTTEVQLGHLGEIAENYDKVMRVQFVDGWTDRPYPMSEAPLIRGAVLSTYENGRWLSPRDRGRDSLPARQPLSFVRQKISIEPMDKPVLFGVFPIFSVGRPDHRLMWNVHTEMLVREYSAGTEMEYEIGTTAIRDGRQLPIYKSYSARQIEPRRTWLQPFSAGDPTPPQFAGLTKAAQEVLAGANIDLAADPGKRIAAARALNSWLRDSGLFAYTLEGSARSTGVDPLEDFVATNRQGHCEYFAGALALMLRSQGIPARVAVGFKGAEWNDAGGYYQVRQSHAHTWVEAWLDPEHFTDEALASLGSEAASAEGAWLNLDPTSSLSEDDALKRANEGFFSKITQYYDYAQVLWMIHVVQMNKQRQQELIYEPAEASLHTVIDPETWRERIARVREWTPQSIWNWLRGNWFSWRGGLASCVVLIGLVVFYRLARRAVRWLAAQAAARKRAPQLAGPGSLEIYRRLERVLAGRGWLRRAAQTPYEFAVAAGGELAESIEHQRLAPLPRRVVEAFYRLRFSRHALDNHESQAVEHALRELEAALSKGDAAKR